MSDSLFAGNRARLWGGGIRIAGTSTPRIVNSTIVGNETEYRGGGVSGSASLENCIIRDNLAPTEDAEQIDSVDFARSSNIQGWASQDWVPGTNNIDADPLFLDPANGDYRLQPGSPCIDAGDNALVPPDEFDLDNDGDTAEPIPFDLDGNHRIAFGRVDMGAFEVQWPEPAVDCAPAGGDGLITIADIVATLGAFGTGPSPCDTEPVNADGTLGDGIISIADVLALIQELGMTRSRE